MAPAISNHHAEWLSLVETSGPFLSVPVLTKTFPQGLDAPDRDVNGRLRSAREQLDEDRSLHRSWCEFVLREVLQLDDALVSGPEMPVGVEHRMAEQGETLRPDLAVVDRTGGAPRAILLVGVYEPGQRLDRRLVDATWAASPIDRIATLCRAKQVPPGSDTCSATNAPLHEHVALPRRQQARRARERDSFEVEYRVIAADERVVVLRDIVAVDRHGDGALRSLRGVIVDVTALRELEERFARAQTMEVVGQLAGGIAHDFNNLLTIVSGHAGLLLHETESAEMRRDLEEIIGAARRAAELTRQLLTFARRDLQSPQQLDPNASLQSLEPMLRGLLDDDIELELRPDPHTPRVEIEPKQFEQLLLNLILNARDAMPTGGRLTVRTGARHVDPDYANRAGLDSGMYALVSVSDTGAGIAPEIQAHVFEPFFTTKPVGQGTGLGLASVHGIVQGRGGIIELESQPGHGTTFQILLPATPIATAMPATNHRGRAKATVLAVEDEPNLRRLVARILDGAGYEVLQAADGHQALTLAQQHPGPIDLLLTDVVMPQLSGPELARHLRRLRPHVAVLYMSGYADSRLARRGVDEPHVHLIHKPFEPSALLRTVANLTSTD